MRRIAALAAGLAVLFVVAASAGAQTLEFGIPIDTVVRAPAGSVTELVRVDTPDELIGCVGVARGENQDSVHPGNDLIIESGGQSIVIEDVERAPSVITPASGDIVLGPEVVVSLRMGEDGVFSGGLVVLVGENCTPATTTTTAPTTTTTAPTTTTTAPTTTTTTAPATTTTEPQPPTTLPTPAIAIDKSPDFQQAAAGVATFTITVTNTGPEDLTQVAVEDDAALAIDPTSDCPNPSVPDLAANGGSFAYECTVTGLTVFPWTNTATATGIGVISRIPVTATDTAVVGGVENTTITQPPTTEAPTTTESTTETLPNTGAGDELGNFATVGGLLFLAGVALLSGAALIGRLREER